MQNHVLYIYLSIYLQIDEEVALQIKSNFFNKTYINKISNTKNILYATLYAALLKEQKCNRVPKFD